MEMERMVILSEYRLNKLWKIENQLPHFQYRFFSLMKCVFGKNIFCQLNYFTIQFIFAIIHGSYYTISVNFYFYLQYFKQKVFNFNKINGSQINLKIDMGERVLFNSFLQIFFYFYSNVRHTCIYLIFKCNMSYI